jgi:LPXTG-site transpeptidase (sortase) family protein
MPRGKRALDIHDKSYKTAEYNGYDSKFDDNKYDTKDENNFNQYDYETEEYEDEEISKKKIVIIFLIILIIAACIFAAIYINKNKEVVIEEEPVVEENVGMASTYNGYKVLGKIVFDDYDIEQYILDSTEDKALENGVIKLYGGTLNNYGNFCIAGHNYEGVFKKLSEMNIGDTFKIIDTDMNETIYEIKDIYQVEPDDLSALLQSDEKVEITLITCEDGATTRLIVKAEEKKNTDTLVEDNNVDVENSVDENNTEENV